MMARAVLARAPLVGVVVLLLAGCTAPTPAPAGVTDAEARAVAAQQQADLWSLSSYNDGVAFPDVAPVELVSPSTWASRQVTCLLAAGLPAREISGGFAVDGNGALSPADSSLAQATCLAQYPVDPRTQGYLSDEQALYLYDYSTERLVPCLRLFGIEGAPPPDRLAYVGRLRAGILWTPYLDVDGAPVQRTALEWSVINSRCPPLTDAAYRLFGPPVHG